METATGQDDIFSLNLEMSALLNMNRAIGSRLNRDELFGALAGSLKTLIMTDRFGIELPIEGERLQGHILSPRPAVTEPTQPTVLPADGTVCDWVIQNRTMVITASLDELKDRYPVTYQVMSTEGMQSLCAMPLVSGGRCRGALFFMAASKDAYNRVRPAFLEQVASTVAVALDNCLAHEEVRELRDRLQAENSYLASEIKTEQGFEDIIGQSQSLRKALGQVERVAPTNSTVLILGETGTGKELVARAIHNLSNRKDRVLVKVNCSALPTGLIESELFGHEKGAFTGATSRKKGRFELADGGTLFLDEVGDLPIETQIKLLRVLQEQEFQRLGGTETLKVDVRLITATNRNLEDLVKVGAFRNDLFYRLNIFPIHLPPLRNRLDDIPALASYFVRKFSRRMGKPTDRISSEAMNALMKYSWPGNVRELANLLERAVILCDGGILHREHIIISELPNVVDVPVPTLQETEKVQIVKALEKTNWIVGGPLGAAKLLGLNRTTLIARMKKLGITRPNELT
ncbi:MAG TPA: sigma 54-interacting transcriptional regulator [Acidobacteriota bacterium]|nr:sigma 54-interacting transcriptional regulator [Acidobacteriota bacterium]